MISWTLVLTMYAFDSKAQSYSDTQVIEYKGFSTKLDCEKAGEAVGDIFIGREGIQNMISVDCRRA